MIQSLNITNGTGTITLGFFAGSVSFSIDNQTELGDETDRFDPIAWSDIRAGDFLEVNALLNDNQIIATEVRFKNTSHDVIQGPVESPVVNNEVTLFGLKFITTGAAFEDANDKTISSVDFFKQVIPGDLVKVQDDLATDGIANEVEFED